MIRIRVNIEQEGGMTDAMRVSGPGTPLEVNIDVSVSDDVDPMHLKHLAKEAADKASEIFYTWPEPVGNDWPKSEDQCVIKDQPQA